MLNCNYKDLKKFIVVESFMNMELLPGFGKKCCVTRFQIMTEIFPV